MIRIILVLAFCLPLLAEEQKTETVESLKAELAYVRAQFAQCSQEMELWQLIPVMEVRLALARETAKRQPVIPQRGTEAVVPAESQKPLPVR